jgi:hypothetical protein
MNATQSALRTCSHSFKALRQLSCSIRIYASRRTISSAGTNQSYSPTFSSVLRDCTSTRVEVHGDFCYSLTPSDLHEAIAALGTLPNLQSLHFLLSGDYYPLFLPMEALALCLERSRSTLRSIRIKHRVDVIGIWDTGMQQLVQALQGNQQLTYFEWKANLIYLERPCSQTGIYWIQSWRHCKLAPIYGHVDSVTFRKDCFICHPRR